MKKKKKKIFVLQRGLEKIQKWSKKKKISKNNKKFAVPKLAAAQLFLVPKKAPVLGVLSSFGNLLPVYTSVQVLTLLCSPPELSLAA